MSKPDLIELSTDWATALRVADRYTGLGCERGDEYFLEQGHGSLPAYWLSPIERARGTAGSATSSKGRLIQAARTFPLVNYLPVAPCARA